MNIKKNKKTLIIDLSGEKDINEILIKIPNDFLIPKFLATTKNSKLLFSEKAKFGFVEVSAKVGKHPKKIKVPRNINVKKQDEVAGQPFSEVSPLDWLPRHVVQYFKFMYKETYGDNTSLPLELEWDDTGKIGNAKDRSKSWAHAKHLIDKFVRLSINKKKIPDYIKFTYIKFDIEPTMALISCNNWIDRYFLEVVLKRRRRYVEAGEETKIKSNQWRNVVDKLK